MQMSKSSKHGESSVLLVLSLFLAINAAFGFGGRHRRGSDADEPAKLNKLEVSVFYEALCPDSMSFIRSRLYNAMIEKQWLRYTDLHFIPYGKVTSWTDKNNVTFLSCQHGKRECELNALHACIVENNNIREQMLLISCLLLGYNTNINQCAQEFEIDISAATECKNSRNTVDILKKYGEQTDANDFTFIPYVTIDGVFDPHNQRNLLYNFDNTFCSLYKEKYGVTLKDC